MKRMHSKQEIENIAQKAVSESITTESIYVTEIHENGESGSYITLNDEGIYIEGAGVTLYNSNSDDFVQLDNSGINMISTNTIYLAGQDEMCNISLSGDTVSILNDGEGTGIIMGPDAALILTGLPTSDPQVAGAVWNDNGVLKISSGE